MLENTLLMHIDSLKEKYNLTSYQIKKLSEQLKYWKKGTLVYPGALKSKINMNIKDVYDILEKFTKDGTLERNYEIYCTECKKFKGKIVRSLSDIPEDCSCDFCDDPIDPLYDTIAIYRVVLDE